MKIIVHDCSGHPFQVQLSRHLARLGHEVTHVWFAEEVGPKGAMVARIDDPAGLRFVGIKLGARSKTLISRRFSEVAYGRKVAALIDEVRPHVVLSGNVPTEGQEQIVKACKSLGVRFVYWLQDVYSIAVTTYMSKQLGLLGQAIGGYYRFLDKRHMRRSDAIIAITQDFVPVAAEWGGDKSKVTVIENWGAISELPLRHKKNEWAHEHALDETFCFMYNGTLGRKHQPSLLISLAERAVGTVVVAGEGFGFDRLTRYQEQQQLENLKLLPLQSAERLPNVLGTADVLIAIIEADAASFAVPSKVLSYLCAGRPILLAAPEGNLAARTVKRADAGIVVDPSDEAGFLAAARSLRSDKDLRTRYGNSGRRFAEKMFDIDRISRQFETVLRGNNEQ